MEHSAMSPAMPRASAHMRYKAHTLIIVACIVLFAVVMEMRVRTAETMAERAPSQTIQARRAFDTAILQAHQERQRFWGAALKHQEEQEKKLKQVISTQNKIIEK